MEKSETGRKNSVAAAVDFIFRGKSWTAVKPVHLSFRVNNPSTSVQTSMAFLEVVASSSQYLNTLIFYWILRALYVFTKSDEQHAICEIVKCADLWGTTAQACVCYLRLLRVWVFFTHWQFEKVTYYSLFIFPKSKPARPLMTAK